MTAKVYALRDRRRDTLAEAMRPAMVGMRHTIVELQRLGYARLAHAVMLTRDQIGRLAAKAGAKP